MKILQARVAPTRTGGMMCVLIAALCLINPKSLLGQNAKATAERPAQVLFVPTFHFGNPGKDVVKLETLDITSDAKQAEVLAVVEKLSKFRPTKVAIEATSDRVDEFDRLYRAYLAGEHQLSVNERQQLGFRVAAEKQLPRLHLIDHAGTFPIGPVMAYAQQNDPEFMKRFQGKIKRIEDEMNRFQRELTILEIIRKECTPQRVEQGQSMYVEVAELGGGDTFVGADLLAAWLDRNVRIFANLAAIAEPDDRIIVLFGAGHTYIIQDLIRVAPNLELVDATKYLGT